MTALVVPVSAATRYDNPLPRFAGRSQVTAARPRPVRHDCGCITRLADWPPVLHLDHACTEHARDRAGFLSRLLDATGLRGRVLPATQPTEGDPS